jgi:hypothetical protein
MDRQESQSNWPDMQKTLGKTGFFSGEDRIRTTGEIPGKAKFKNEVAQKPTHAASHIVRWHRARQRSCKTNALTNDPTYRVTTLGPLRIYRVTSKTPEKI